MRGAIPAIYLNGLSTVDASRGVPVTGVRQHSIPRRPWGAVAAVAILLAVYSYTLWLMLLIVLQYTGFESDVAFLAIKQDYTGLLHYRVAFFLHVFSSILVLLAAYTQFSSRIRTRHRAWHRSLGKLYAYTVVYVSGPTGLIIGLYANGGLWSRIAFCLLAVLWIWFTVLALQKLRQRKIEQHAQWMIRSYALALSAITLRAWKVAIVFAFHPAPMDAYRLVAWLGWVVNLALAELLIVYLVRRKLAQRQLKQSLNLQPSLEVTP
jgi:hypothetical protein